MKKVFPWVRPFLQGGSIINALLACFFLLFPHTSHQLLFGSAPFFPFQAVQVYGILLAVLAIGYLAVSYNPFNHTVILLMGLLANLLFVLFLFFGAGAAIWQYGAMLFWIVVACLWSGFILSMLKQGAELRRSQQSPQSLDDQAYRQEPLSKILLRFRTQRGKSLLQLSNEQPTLLIFLKDLQSAYTRETLADIRQQRMGIEHKGTQIILVHLAEQEQAREILDQYELSDLHHISDPNGIMYGAFGLGRNAETPLSAWRTWFLELLSAHQKKESSKWALKEDRMPGVFLVSKGEIVRSYRYHYTSRRPDYRQLASDQAA